MPTEMRISESAMPISLRRSAPISQKIVCATGIASVRLSPRFDDDTTMLEAVQEVEAVDAVDELEREEPAETARTAYFASACCGCDGSPG